MSAWSESVLAAEATKAGSASEVTRLIPIIIIIIIIIITQFLTRHMSVYILFYIYQF